MMSKKENMLIKSQPLISIALLFLLTLASSCLMSLSSVRIEGLLQALYAYCTLTKLIIFAEFHIHFSTLFFSFSFIVEFTYKWTFFICVCLYVNLWVIKLKRPKANGISCMTNVYRRRKNL